MHEHLNLTKLNTLSIINERVRKLRLCGLYVEVPLPTHEKYLDLSYNLRAFKTYNEFYDYQRYELPDSERINVEFLSPLANY